MCSLPDELLTMLGLGVEVCSLWIPESVWHGLFSWCGDIGGDVHSYIAPENRPSQMESCIPTSNHPFSGAMLVSGRVIHRVCMGFIWCWSDSMHFVGSMGHQNTKKSTCFKRIKAARIFENCRLTVSTNRFREGMEDSEQTNWVLMKRLGNKISATSPTFMEFCCGPASRRDCGAHKNARHTRKSCSFFSITCPALYGR